MIELDLAEKVQLVKELFKNNQFFYETQAWTVISGTPKTINKLQ